eukprot:GILI01011743.1.p1 GENE.GILI01011743.1~~GILI01011743.1.p1  ORF type:complete len:445 (+),score=121.81 GILI01011743.1:111-1445(+)
MKLTWLLFIGGLIFGTITSICTKLQFQTESIGIDGTAKLFEKPWFTSLWMFTSMSAAMPLYWYEQYRKRRQVKEKKTPLLGPDNHSTPTVQEEEPEVTLRTYIAMLGPSLFDLIASTLAQIGLLFTTVSVYQMLKGALLIFSALLSVVYLKRRLYRHNWIGLFLCTLALAMVGAASLYSNQGAADISLELFGIGLIVAGQLVQALQFVVEEALLRDAAAPPLLIVGMEGVWGVLAMVLFFLPVIYFIPGADAGSYENTLDTFAMLKNNPSMWTSLWLYWFAVLAYNICGICVTQLLSAIHHTILDTLRTLCVWGVDLLLFYVFTDGKRGEAWDEWSWLQLAGFFVLVYGTLIYDGLVKLPGLEYPPELSHDHHVHHHEDVLGSPQTPLAKQLEEDPAAAVRASPVVPRAAVFSSPSMPRRGHSHVDIQSPFSAELIIHSGHSQH